MVRNYVKKTNQGNVPGDVIRRAISCFNTSGRSIRAVAEQYGLNHVSFSRYIKKAETSGGPDNLSFDIGRFRQVFSEEQEKVLGEYLTEAANIYFGLSPKEVRVLAYDCAMVHKIAVPDSWHTNKQAGEDWFSNFLKRNPKLSIRTPEPTRLSRATSFNRSNVQIFFEKLGHVIDRDNIDPGDIWNCDETGITTVQKPRNIVAPKGVKQIGQLTSAERGAHITMCAAANAIGNSMPPMFVFPRVNYHEHFVRDGPAGCIGASHPSGWMTAPNFVKFFKHFIQHAKPTTDRKVLLLLDNHISHISVDALNLAKENGVVMLSFPPHCSHKLQPLDRTVFGPLKKLVNSAQDSWMRNHPGRSMTIYDIPSQIKDSWPLAATPKNVTSGFSVSGVFPYNSDIFSDHEFAPCSVTDRPAPECAAEPEIPSHPNQTTGVDVTIQDVMMNLGREVVLVPGDGHCLLHAFMVTLLNEGIATVSLDEICESLLKEVSENIDYYDDFATETQSIIQDIERYLHDKSYNTDTADLVINALCNVYGVSAIVYRYVSTDDNNIQINGIAPGTMKIHEQYVEHRAQTPSTPQFTARPLFSPEIVRPHPKAAPRKSLGKSKPRRRKSAILTDTPEMTLIEEEFENKQKKQNKSSKKQNEKANKEKLKPVKKSKKEQSTKKKAENSSDEEDEWYCLICVEPFSNSRPGEDWVQCYVCKGWAHDECTGASKNQIFICQNCDSDDDILL